MSTKLNHRITDLELHLACGEQDLTSFSIVNQHRITLDGNAEMIIFICAEGHLICLRDAFSKFWEFVGAGGNKLLNNRVANQKSNEPYKHELPWLIYHYQQTSISRRLVTASTESNNVVEHTFNETEDGPSSIVRVNTDVKTTSSSPSDRRFKVVIQTVHDYHGADDLLVTTSTFSNDTNRR